MKSKNLFCIGMLAMFGPNSPLMAGDGVFIPYIATIENVPLGDVLNLREGPSAHSKDIGDLANGDVHEITGVSGNDKWLRVNLGEKSGWISKAYAAPRPASGFQYQCFGTEPFWSVRLNDLEPAILSTPEVGAESHEITSLTLNRAKYSWHLDIEGPTLMGEIAAHTCNDGMSDRSFGWAFRGTINEREIKGCCSLN